MIPQATLVQQVTQSSYGLLDARVNWHLDTMDLDVALFGRNLTNKAFFDQGINLEFGGFNVLFEAPPRIYGVEVIKKFGK
jgi:iron complex outermembrane receptor protein